MCVCEVFITLPTHSAPLYPSSPLPLLSHTLCVCLWIRVFPDCFCEARRGVASIHCAAHNSCIIIDSYKFYLTLHMPLLVSGGRDIGIVGGGRGKSGLRRAERSFNSFGFCPVSLPVAAPKTLIALNGHTTSLPRPSPPPSD